MAWCRIGDEALSEPILILFTDAYMRYLREMNYWNTEQLLRHKCVVIDAVTQYIFDDFSCTSHEDTHFDQMQVMLVPIRTHLCSRDFSSVDCQHAKHQSLGTFTCFILFDTYAKLQEDEIVPQSWYSVLSRQPKGNLCELLENIYCIIYAHYMGFQ